MQLSEGGRETIDFLKKQDLLNAMNAPDENEDEPEVLEYLEENYLEIL